MADAQRTIELIFKGVDQVSAVSDAVINSTRNFAGGVESATQPMADLTVNALQLEAGILAAGAAMTSVAVIAAGQFDSAFREIDTLVDAPVEAMSQFQQELLEYSATSTQSFDSIQAATYSAISAGVDYTESLSALSTAEQLAVAGRGDLNDSMVLLVSTLNAYGAEMDEASRYSDILFTTVRQGQTTLPELAATLSNVTGTAAVLGVEFPELAAAFAALTSVGIPSAQATTALNAAMQALIAPSSQAAELASQLGIEFNAQAVEANGLEGVLQDVYQATGGNAEQMATLFSSTEALRAVLPLTGNAADEFAANLEAMSNSSGATQRAFDEMADALDLVRQRVANSFNYMLVELGRPLLDEIGGIGNAISEIFRAVGQGFQDEDGLGQIVRFIEQNLQDLQRAFEEIARNLPEALERADLSGFTTGLTEIREAIEFVLGDVDLTSVDGLATAITRVSDGFRSLSTVTGQVIRDFSPMIDAVFSAGETFSQLSEETLRTIGHVGSFATQANILAGAVSGLLPSMGSLLAIVAINQGGGLIGGLRSAAEVLGGQTGLIARLGQAGLVAAAGAGGYAIGTVLGGALDRLVNSLTENENSLGTWIYEITHAGEAAEGAGGSIGGLPPIVDDLNRAIERVNLDNLLIPADQLTRDASALAQITRGYEALRVAAGEAYDPNVNLTAALESQAHAVDSLLIPQDMLTRSVDDWSNVTTGIVPIYDQATGAIVGYEQGIIAAGSAQERANAAIQQSIANINGMAPVANSAAAAVRNLASANAEISDDVAIAFIEAGSEERIAQIEATTERIRSAYESVNVTIESTGDLIGQALGLLADSDTNIRGRFDVERQLDLENQRRGDALELQEDLTRAQIQQLEAQAAALSRGDGIIQISGDGLAPHLEAIMWEVIEQVQIRVNQDGMGMLLGV